MSGRTGGTGEMCEIGSGDPGQWRKGKGQVGVEARAHSEADGPEQSWGYP